MLPGGGLALALALVMLVLAAAKGHGRQVRIARERVGVTSVDFRKDNGPVVEAIWRHDRIRFWAVVAAVALVLVTLAAVGRAFMTWPRAGAIAIAATLAFAAGFVVAGLAAWAPQLVPRHGDPAWMGRANVVSFGWWLLVSLAAGLVALAL